MTGRAAAIQGGLAAFGLLAAHFTWQREPEHAPGAVTVIDATKSDVTRVHYEDEQDERRLRARPRRQEPAVWLHLVAGAETGKDRRPSRAPRRSPQAEDAACAAARSGRQRAGGQGARSVRAARLATRLRRARRGQAQGAGAGVRPTRKLDVTVKGDVRHYVIGQPDKATGGESFLRDTARRTRLPHAARDARRSAEPQPPRRSPPARLRAGRLRPDGARRRAASRRSTSSSIARRAPRPASRPPRRPTSAIRWPRTGTTPSGASSPPRSWAAARSRPAASRPSSCASTTTTARAASAAWSSRARKPLRRRLRGALGAAGDIYARTEHTAGWVKLHNGGQLVADAQKLVAPMRAGTPRRRVPAEPPSGDHELTLARVRERIGG